MSIPQIPFRSPYAILFAPETIDCTRNEMFYWDKCACVVAITHLSEDVFVWRRRWRWYRVVLYHSRFRRRGQSQKLCSLPRQFQGRVLSPPDGLSRILLHHPKATAASPSPDSNAARRRRGRLPLKTEAPLLWALISVWFWLLSRRPTAPKFVLLCRQLFWLLCQQPRRWRTLTSDVPLSYISLNLFLSNHLFDTLGLGVNLP